jgi:hypothetical protein
MEFENIIKKVEKEFSLKKIFDIGDLFIVLIEFESPEKETIYSTMYFRLNKMEKDEHKKGDWWFCTFSMLTFPIQQLIWTLRSEQLVGEVFTMGGFNRWMKPLSFEPVEPVIERKPEKKKTDLKPSTQSKSNLINFADLKKGKDSGFNGDNSVA